MERYKGGANRVEGLTKRQARSVATYLRGRGDTRNELLWVLGITTGLRISDLLKLRWGDLVDADGRIVDTFTVRETKTRKARTLTVLSLARDALQRYETDHRPTLADFLFAGRTGRVITREQARRLVKQWCEECNLRGDIGTHTLRKTFCTVAYENSGGDPVATARVTGHSNPAQLLHYIGRTTQTEREILAGIDKAFRE